MIKFIKALKYHPIISRIARFVFWPFIKVGVLSEWFKLRVKINGGAIRYFGTSLKFPRNVGVNILSNIYWYGDDGHEKLMGQSMAVALKHAGVFLDIGSNFGFYSVWAQKLNPVLLTFCFEPVDHLFEDNRRFHAANQASRATRYNRALGDHNGTATIMIPKAKGLKFLITSATLSNDFAAHKGFKTISKEVEIVTLDSFVSEIREKVGSGLHKTVIKIDVEGFEAAVLAGGAAFFKHYKPLVFIEIFLREKNIESIVSFSKVVNYQLYALVPQGLVQLTPGDLKTYAGDRNFVMLPRQENFSDQNLLPYAGLDTFFSRQQDSSNEMKRFDIGV